MIRRPINSVVFSAEPADLRPSYRRAAQEPVLLIRKRREPDAPTTEPQDTEATPSTSCSTCEDFAETLSRIETGLTVLLDRVDALGARLDAALGEQP